MNNKKIFSVKMFWQSFLQLKVIGFISTILMVLITCVPICISAVNIKSNIEYAGVEKASRYVQLVDGNDFISILILTFAIITPLSSNLFNNSGVKCNPAVGAAADPSYFA